MAFSDDFAACMSPLPVPSLEAAAEVGHVLDEVHTAWEAAGGDEEMLLGALAGVGALLGVDEAALETGGELAQVAVEAYLTACAACLVSALAQEVWALASASDTPSWLQQSLAQAANSAGIAQPEATA